MEPAQTPTLHELVGADLATSFPRADALGLVRTDLRTQQEVTLEDTGSLPRPGDGCHALGYLYKTLIDAAVHTRQIIAETYVPGMANPMLARVYHGLLHQLLDVRRMIQAGKAGLS